MNPLPGGLSAKATRAVLQSALCDVHGSGARLEKWGAHPLPPRGKCQVVRYDLCARMTGVPYVQHHQWVGRFYDGDDAAHRAGTVLRQLGATDGDPRSDLLIPGVVAHAAPHPLLLLTYHPGESLTSAIVRYDGLVPRTLGRALAALHGTRVMTDAVASPAAALDGVRRRIADLCERFPDLTDRLRNTLVELEGDLPDVPATPAFLHGHLGPASLSWHMARIVLLDADHCRRGDPAWDLGSLLGVVRRLTLRESGRLPDFESLRTAVLNAYQAWPPQDPGLARRVGWYERVALVRMAHRLASPATRDHNGAETEARRAEAVRVLGAVLPDPKRRAGPRQSVPDADARDDHRDERALPSPSGVPDAPRRLRRFLLDHVGRVRGPMALAAICTLGLTATELLQPWPLKMILDYGILRYPLPDSLSVLRGIMGTSSGTLVVSACGAIVVIALARSILAYLQIFITASLGHTMVYALRRELFAHLQRLSLSFHNRARSGDLLMTVARDTNALKDVVSESVLKFTAQFLTVAGMFAVLLAVDWRSGLIAAAALPFLGYTLFHLYRRTKRSVKAQKRHDGEVASRISEVLSAVPVVQAFAREGYEERRLDVATARTMRESIRVARLQAAATRSAEVITAVGMAVAVLFGALHVLDGAMMPGDLVLIVAYLGNMYRPIKGMARLTNELSSAMAGAERISDVLDLEPEIRDRPDAIETPRIRGEIGFRHVSFDYGNGKGVLRDVSFGVAPGQCLALVGPSGAGKSTIVSLILRLYEPQAGAILIDGIDIRQYRREALRRQIGLVLQDSLLFGATIRENIGYGRPEASLEEIVAAAAAANADEFVRTLDDGYETVIGERGVTLSGGQRQRLAIARALIRDAPILILDEPMTGLDAGSEAKVREALRRLMTGKTCILITHDLPSVADADQVLVLDGGRIVESGCHADLLASSTGYRHLYDFERHEATVGTSAREGR